MVTFTEKDILLLGHSKSSIIEDNSEWILYKGEVKAGMRSSFEHFIYLKSSASLSSIDKFNILYPKIRDIFVIIPPKSVTLKTENIKKQFNAEVEIYASDDLIWKKTKELFSDYINLIKSDLPKEKHFISPSAKKYVSNDRIKEFMPELMLYLSNQSKILSKNNVKVLIADAGVGKTTFARSIVHGLIDALDKYKIIPIYVEASHWNKIRIETLDTLWELIENSLQNFGQKISITENLFHHMLLLGRLVFIFDGFDELCIKKIPNFTKESVIQDIINLSSEEGRPKIVITSRKVYWETINSELFAEYLDEIEIERFNKPQASRYFEKHFSTDKTKLSQVITLNSKLQKGINPKDGGYNNRFINLPFVLNMLVELVDGGIASEYFKGEKNILNEILILFCEREIKRQQLLTQTEDQLSAFEEISLMNGQSFEPNLLEVAGFEADDIHKLKDHPLLSYYNGECLFKYEFLRPYFQASYVHKNVDRGNHNDVFKVIKSDSSPASIIQEHLQLFFTKYSDIVSFAQMFNLASGDNKNARNFIFHFIKSKLWEFMGSDTLKEKTNKLSELLCGDKHFNGLIIFNEFTELDLRDVTISHSEFIDAHCTKLKVNENTTFKICKFDGATSFTDNDTEIKKICFIDCSKGKTLPFATASLLGLPDDKKDVILEALIIAASKFWRNGRYRLTISKHIWHKGALVYFPWKLKDHILAKFKKYSLVEDVTVSGVTEGCYRFNREYTQELSKLMDNRHLSGPFKKTYDDLNSEL